MRAHCRNFDVAVKYERSFGQYFRDNLREASSGVNPATWTDRFNGKVKKASLYILLLVSTGGIAYNFLGLIVDSLCVNLGLELRLKRNFRSIDTILIVNGIFNYKNNFKLLSNKYVVIYCLTWMCLDDDAYCSWKCLIKLTHQQIFYIINKIKNQ